MTDDENGVAGLLLAAGGGRRLGGRPKALLAHRGRLLVEHAAEVLRVGGCARVHVVLGDARSLPELAGSCGFLDDGPADAIVSGLGLLTMPPSLQEQIITAAFQCLRAGGVFIQFTYGPAAPVADSVVRQMKLRVHRGEFVLRNVPPATVYVYARHAEAGHRD